MNNYQSFSKKERGYGLVYVLGLSLLCTITFIIILANKFKSPFSQQDALALQMLEQKNKFTQQQKIVEPLLVSCFTKISVLPLTTIQPFAENDIKNSVNEVANSFGNVDVYDPRKEAYPQIAQFYKMFFEDKKIAAKKTENIQLFEKELEECSIGFKDKEQQLMQKKNALLSRSTNN